MARVRQRSGKVAARLQQLLLLPCERQHAVVDGKLHRRLSDTSWSSHQASRQLVQDHIACDACDGNPQDVHDHLGEGGRGNMRGGAI